MNNKLERFIEAQEKSYEEALKEIKNGRKAYHHRSLWNKLACRTYR